eukprot:scaffold52458_cov69-Phaeocystis_antarctica.AAC.3
MRRIPLRDSNGTVDIAAAGGEWPTTTTGADTTPLMYRSSSVETAVLRASRRDVLPGGGRGLVQIGGSYHALVPAEPKSFCVVHQGARRAAGAYRGDGAAIGTHTQDRMRRCGSRCWTGGVAASPTDLPAMPRMGPMHRRNFPAALGTASTFPTRLALRCQPPPGAVAAVGRRLLLRIEGRVAAGASQRRAVGPLHRANLEDGATRARARASDPIDTYLALVPVGFVAVGGQVRIALAPLRRSARDDRRVIPRPQAEEQPSHGARVLCRQVEGVVGPSLAHRSLHVVVPHDLDACLPQLRPGIVLRRDLAQPRDHHLLVGTEHCHLVPQPSEAEDIIERPRQATPPPPPR